MSPEVVPFERTAQDSRGDSTQVDRAGETILQLLGKAADVADRNSRQAIETAQRLSHQLRAAEDRVAQLEAEIDAYRQKAERAEQWLHTVYTEIEDRFLKQDAPRRARR
jgi:molecular chaperone GrpE (heat shock protein)